MLKLNQRKIQITDTMHHEYWHKWKPSRILLQSGEANSISARQSLHVKTGATSLYPFTTVDRFGAGCNPMEFLHTQGPVLTLVLQKEKTKNSLDSTWETEAGESWVWSQPDLNSGFKDSLATECNPVSKNNTKWTSKTKLGDWRDDLSVRPSSTHDYLGVHV